MKIKKGDTVKILYGKDSGKQGTVVAVDIKNEKVVVEGVNIFKKHIKGDGRTKTSEILSVVKPLDVSKVMLICPVCNKATRVSLRREDGKGIRVCKKCKKDIEVVEKAETEKKEVKKSTKKTVKKEVKKPVKKVVKKTVKKTTKKESK